MRGVGGLGGSSQAAATYDRLCEKQFGIGATFDGEMCACKTGFYVKGGLCAPKSGAGAAAAVEGAGGRGKKRDGNGESANSKGAGGTSRRTMRASTGARAQEGGGDGGVVEDVMGTTQRHSSVSGSPGKRGPE